jgi:ribosomal protein RSM22 (predicted rRNA methylase)
LKDVSLFSKNDWFFSKKSKQAISKESHAFSIDSSNTSVVVSTKNVQIRFESMNQNSTNQESMFESISKSKQTRKKMKSLSTDFVSMNTRSRTRKSIYVIALIIVNHFISYYATFSIELQRSNQS